MAKRKNNTLLVLILIAVAFVFLNPAGVGVTGTDPKLNENVIITATSGQAATVSPMILVDGWCEGYAFPDSSVASGCSEYFDCDSACTSCYTQSVPASRCGITPTPNLDGRFGSTILMPSTVEANKMFDVTAEFTADVAGTYYLEAGIEEPTVVYAVYDAQGSKCDSNTHAAGIYIPLQANEKATVNFHIQAWESTGTKKAYVNAYSACGYANVITENYRTITITPGSPPPLSGQYVSNSISVPRTATVNAYFDINASFKANVAGKYYLEAGIQETGGSPIQATLAQGSKCDGDNPSPHAAGAYADLTTGQTIDMIFRIKTGSTTGTKETYVNAYSACGWDNRITTNYQTITVTQGPCTPNWQTGTWGTCSGGIQSRTVTDLNNCGSTTNKPATTQACGNVTTTLSGTWSNVNFPPEVSTNTKFKVKATYTANTIGEYFLAAENTEPLVPATQAVLVRDNVCDPNIHAASKFFNLTAGASVDVEFEITSLATTGLKNVAIGAYTDCLKAPNNGIRIGETLYPEITIKDVVDACAAKISPCILGIQHCTEKRAVNLGMDQCGACEEGYVPSAISSGSLVRNSCILGDAACGNLITELNEECDEGALGGSLCNSDCTWKAGTELSFSDDLRIRKESVKVPEKVKTGETFDLSVIVDNINTKDAGKINVEAGIYAKSVVEGWGSTGQFVWDRVINIPTCQEEDFVAAREVRLQPKGSGVGDAGIADYDAATITFTVKAPSESSKLGNGDSNWAGYGSKYYVVVSTYAYCFDDPARNQSTFTGETVKVPITITDESGIGGIPSLDGGLSKLNERSVATILKSLCLEDSNCESDTCADNTRVQERLDEGITDGATVDSSIGKINDGIWGPVKTLGGPALFKKYADVEVSSVCVESGEDVSSIKKLWNSMISSLSGLFNVDKNVASIVLIGILAFLAWRLTQKTS